MSALWQELAAYAAVFIAATWLVVRWRRRKRAACAGCHANDLRRNGPHAAAGPKRSRIHLPVVDVK